MPFYEYECTNCGVVEEFIRKVEKRREPGICPCCHSVMTYVDKVHPTNFALKGKGWFRDGYGSTDKPKASVTNISSAKKSEAK